LLDTRYLHSTDSAIVTDRMTSPMPIHPEFDWCSNEWQYVLSVPTRVTMDRRE